MLPIIGLVEVDFNSALKHFFARELMRRAEENNAMDDEQWGLRKNHTSTDAAMLRIITFDCGQIKKSTIGVISEIAKHVGTELRGSNQTFTHTNKMCLNKY